MDLHMWSYWRDKYGIEDALHDYFPEVINSDPVILAALAQRRMAELAINARMKELEEEDSRPLEKDGH